MNNILIIKQPQLVINNDRAILASTIIWPGETRQLQFECAAEHADKLTPESSDGFLVALLLLAMTKGLDIAVEGSISSRLYYNLTYSYIELIRTFLPNSKKIAIKAQTLHSQKWGGTGVITGFSGGIDSFCTYAEHSGLHVVPEYAITHFLLNDVGAYEEGHLESSEVAQKHFRRMQKFAEERNIPLIRISSNMDEIIPVDFVHSHTIRNISVALLLQKICGKFIYSSGVHYQNAFVAGAKDIAYFDAIGVHLLSTETMECISGSSQYTRFERTEIVSGNAASYQHLDVCIRHENTGTVNCSRCTKCLRTQLSLEVCGALEHYAAVFNLDTYKRYRWLYLFYIWKDANPVHKEIKDAIAKRRHPVPYSAKLAAAFLPKRLKDIVFYRGIELKHVTMASILWSAIVTGIKKRF